jgi:hypothetical protein
VIKLWPMSVWSTLALNLPAAAIAETISAAKVWRHSWSVIRAQPAYWNTIYTQHALDDLPHNLAGDEPAGLTPTLFEHGQPARDLHLRHRPARRAAPAAARSQRRVSFH